MIIEAKKDKLSEVIAFVDAYLEARECSMKVQTQIEIAVEEIFVNIASYAYGEKGGSAEISMRFYENPRRVEITFTDSGIPYNPLEKEDPDITLRAEERVCGGLGILMVKKSMDEVRYEYTDDKNRLTLMKYL